MVFKVPNVRLEACLCECMCVCVFVLGADVSG